MQVIQKKKKEINLIEQTTNKSYGNFVGQKLKSCWGYVAWESAWHVSVITADL